MTTATKHRAPAQEVPSITKANEVFARGSVDGLTSAEVSAVVVDAEAALTALRQRAAALRAATLDPSLDCDAVAQATAEAAAVDLEAARMEVAASRLRDRAKEIAADEADAPRWAKYNKAREAREEALRELVAQYPSLAGKIGELLAQARAADVLVGQANADLPRGVKRLEWTHALAAGGSRFGAVSLPALDASDRQHWPTGTQSLL